MQLGSRPGQWRKARGGQGRWFSALFRDQPGNTKPEVAPIDRREIDRGVQVTKADIQRNLDAARPRASQGAWPELGLPLPARG